MPINGIETAYKDRYTFAPLSQRAVPIQWYTLPLRFITGVKSFTLNERELETLTWAARGKTSAQIAQILGLTKRTVEYHLDNARHKLGAATRTHAAIKAKNGRLIEL